MEKSELSSGIAWGLVKGVGLIALVVFLVCLGVQILHATFVATPY